MKRIRDDLKDFVPYKVEDTKYNIKLDANESPFGLADNVKADIINWFTNEENLNIYPDTECVELRKQLSLLYNVSAENIVCGVGSDQIIDYLTKAFLGKDDSIATINPTFSMYGLSAILNHGNNLKFEAKADFSFDIHDIIEGVNRSKCKILFICSPNNPTGNDLSRGEIEEIISKTNCIVAVDEAYGEFSGKTVIDLVDKYDNLIVLRTFSKAYGLAGARVGYGIGSKEIIDGINVVKPPFNLSTISQKLAISVLKNRDEYDKRIKEIIENKNQLYSLLMEIESLKVYESEANFLYVESEIPLYDKLLENGILVRKFNSDNKECLRITVGWKEDNQKLYEVIKKYGR